MDDARAEKFVARWKNGITPYSRIRKHAIHLQLGAVIALALHCGLRRGEIYALHLDDMHYDNAYIVVWRGERWNSTHREIPFTDDARATVAAWIEFRAAMGVEHKHPWLGLSAGKTARTPIRPGTFSKLLSTYVAPELNYRRLRHTCRIGWLTAGMTDQEVQRFLGYERHKRSALERRNLERRVERLQTLFADALVPADESFEPSQVAQTHSLGS